MNFSNMPQQLRVFLLVALSLAVVIGIRMSLPKPEPLTVDNIMAEVDNAGVYAVVAEKFPGDYAEFKIQAQLILSKPNAQAEDIFDWAHGLPTRISKKYNDYIFTAPDQELLALSGAHLAMLEDLRDQPHICASFIRNGTSDLTDYQAKQIKFDLSAGIALAKVNALAAGRDHPISHDAVSNEDVAQIIHDWSEVAHPGDDMINAVLSLEGDDEVICQGFLSLTEFFGTEQPPKTPELLAWMYSTD